MQTFAEWLDEQLTRRRWVAADLTAASRTEDYPRGLDSGLISRWRRRDATAVVPTQAKTLNRLAHALEVPESEVYRAAGLLPADATMDETGQAHLPPRLAVFVAQIEQAFRGMTEQEWLVREEAGRALFSVPPAVKASPTVPVKARRPRPNTHSNRPDSADDTPLQHRYRSHGAGLMRAVSAA